MSDMKIGYLLLLAEATYIHVACLSDIFSTPITVVAKELSSKPTNLFADTYAMLPVKRAFETACLTGSGTLRGTTVPPLVPNLRINEDVELETTGTFSLTIAASPLRASNTMPLSGVLSGRKLTCVAAFSDRGEVFEGYLPEVSHFTSAPQQQAGSSVFRMSFRSLCCSGPFKRLIGSLRVIHWITTVDPRQPVLDPSMRWIVFCHGQERVFELHERH